jgi:peroxiredoxin
LKNKTLILISLFLAVVVITFHAYAKKQPSGDEKGVFDSMNQPRQWIGKTPPDFSVEFLDGPHFNLADHVGKKVVVLNFFATWCGPCRDEMPEFVRYYEKHRDEQFLMIGIDSDEPENTVRRFLREHAVTYPVAIDRGGRLQKQFSVRGLPTTVLIGADGIVHVYEVGGIKNAEVAFDPHVTTGLENIKAGTAISKDAYLAKLLKKGEDVAVGDEAGTEEKAEPAEQPLTGRAKTIADKMNCPCGCSHTLPECTCKTAKDIKEQLRKRDIAALSDEDVIKSLNQEYCMK